MLVLFGLCTSANACSWIMFAPIFNLLEGVYGVSVTVVNYMSVSFFIAFLPVNFPSVIALDKYGLYAGLTTGIVLTAIGLWFRCLINVDFTYAVIG